MVRPGAYAAMRRDKPHRSTYGGDNRGGGPFGPLGMTAGFSPTPLSSSAEVRVPGTEADGVADAMIRGRQNGNKEIANGHEPTDDSKRPERFGATGNDCR